MVEIVGVVLSMVNTDYQPTAMCLAEVILAAYVVVIGL
jgi:hypothetical protein